MKSTTDLYKLSWTSSKSSYKLFLYISNYLVDVLLGALHDPVLSVLNEFEYDVIVWKGSFYFSNSVYFLGIYSIFKFVFVNSFIS